MFSNLNATQKGMILVLVPVIFELTFVSYLSWLLYSAKTELEQIEHSKKAVLQLQSLNDQIASAVLSVEDFGGDETEAQQMADAQRILETSVTAGMESDFTAETNPELKDLLHRCEEVRDHGLELVEMAHSLVLGPGGSMSNFMKHMPREQILSVFMEVQSLDQEIMKIEKRVQAAKPEKLKQLQNEITLTLSIGVLFSLSLSLLLTQFFTSDILSRLNRIAANAHRLAAGKELPEPLPGTDEIAELDRVLYDSNTALKEFLLKERAILDHAADVILSLDVKLRVMRVNAAATKVWNYTPDELLGEHLASLLARSTVERTRKSFEKIIESGGDGEFENIVLCKDGRRKNSLWRVRWSAQDRNFYCVVHDVTELRVMAELKQWFVQMVGHDLGQPLDSINNTVESLLGDKYGPINENIKTSLGRTRASLDRLMDLVDELMELDKLEAGKLVLELDSVDALEVCKEAKESLEMLAQKAGVSIDEPAEGATFVGEHKRMVQVIINLLSNAIKFSPAGTTVTLGVHEKADSVEISVADQGPGIPEEDRAVIFDKFRQSRATSNVDIKGSGIGLAIVRAIAEAHHGQVGVDSRSGGGSIFWVRVPKDLHAKSIKSVRAPARSLTHSLDGGAHE